MSTTVSFGQCRPTADRPRVVAMLAAVVAAAVIAPAPVPAATLYWQGGVGTWNTSSAQWGTASTGPYTSIWNNASNDTAVFSGTAGTVSLNTGITVGGLGFTTNSYAINADGGALTFGAADNVISFSSVASATITGSVGGTGNVSTRLVNPMVGTTLTAFTLSLNGTTAGGWSGTTTAGPLATFALSQSNQALLNTSAIALRGGGIMLTNATTTEAGLNRVNDSAAITANGGGITFTNTATSGVVYAETLGSMSLASGLTNVMLTTDQNSGGGNQQTLTLSGLTRTGATNSSAVAFGSAGNLNTTTNMIVVSGAADSGAGGIIGPWATVGTTADAQTDYARYTNSGGTVFVMPANIAATAENSGSWTAGSNVTLSGATTLTATRTVNSLRYTGVAGSLSLGASSFNLQTNGLLNGGSGLLTVSNAAGGTGGLTTPSGGGYLYLTTGTGGITVSAPITDNGGAVSVVASGSGTLTFSGTNTFTGNVILNNGANVKVTSDVNFGSGGASLIVNGGAGLTVSAGTYARGIQLNNGALLSFVNNNITATFTGNVTGSGGIQIGQAGTAGEVVIFSGTANTFQGPVLIGGLATGNNSLRQAFASLADSATANGPIVFFANSVSHAQGSVFEYTGSSDLVLNNRQIQIVSTGTTPGNGHQLRVTGAGTLTINTDLLVTSTTVQNVRLAGSNTGANEFAGRIGDGAGAVVNVSKSETGRWALTGTNNTYTGTTTILAGTLEVKKLADGGSNSSIGASTNAAANILLANATTLRYTGGGDSTDRSFTINVTAAGQGATLDASGSGALVLTNTASPAYGTTAQTRTLTLRGFNTGTNTLAAWIADNGSGAVSLVKNDYGTWVLSGANTYTGATTVSGGQLVLDYGTQNNSKLSDTTALTLGGGTLVLKGGSHTEVVLSTSVNAGGSMISRDGGTGVAQLNAITRSAQGTLAFEAASIATTDSTNVNSILGGWATLGSNWAINSTNGADGAVTALSSYTGALPAATGASTANYTLTGNQTQTGAVAANTVKITNTGNGETLSLDANNLTITAASATSLGGILYAGGADGNYTIGSTTGRIVPSTANQELIFQTTSGTLTVNAFVAADASSSVVTKSGSGTLVLGAANSFTGAVRVNGGSLRLTSGSGAGTTAGGITVQAGAAVELANDISVGAEALTISGSGVAGGGALRNVSGANVYSGTITAAAPFSILSDSGTLTLNAATAIATSGFNGSLGGAGAIAVSGSVTGAGSLTKTGAGTVTLSAANSYTGGTQIAAGVLVLGDAGALGSAGRISFTGGTLQYGSGVATDLSSRFSTAANQAYSIDTNGQNVSLGSALQSSGGSLAKLGSGTLTLSATNTYTGNTTIAAGILALGAVNAISNQSNLLVNGGGFDLAGFSDTVGTVTLTSGSIFGGGTLSAATYGLGGGTVSASLGGGTLNVTGNAALNGTSAATAVNLNSGALTLGSGGRFTSSSVAVTGSSGASVSLGGNEAFGSLAGAANVALGANTLSVGGAGTSGTYSGVMSGAGGGLTKTGVGKLTLTDAQTYTGNTIITAGTLALGSGGSFANSLKVVVGDSNSSGAVLDLSAKSNFTIGAGQTLQGKGTVLLDASTSLVVAGLLSPGNSPDLLTYDGGLTTLSGTTLMEIWGTSRGANPGYDAIDVINSGTVTLGGMLILDFNQDFAPDSLFTLFGTGTGGVIAGEYTGFTVTGTNNNYVGLSFTLQSPGVWQTGNTVGDQALRLTQTSSSLTLEVIAAAVPEPSTLALAGLGLAGLTLRLRRRRCR